MPARSTLSLEEKAFTVAHFAAFERARERSGRSSRGRKRASGPLGGSVYLTSIFFPSFFKIFPAENEEEKKKREKVSRKYIFIN